MLYGSILPLPKLLLERGDFVGGKACEVGDVRYGKAFTFHFAGRVELVLPQFFKFRLCRIKLLPFLRKFRPDIVEFSHDRRLNAHSVPVSVVSRKLGVAVSGLLDYLQRLGNFGIVQKLLRGCARLLVYLSEELEPQYRHPLLGEGLRLELR